MLLQCSVFLLGQNSSDFLCKAHQPCQNLVGMTSSISGKVIARYAPELLKWMLSGTAGSVHTITWATPLVILAVYAPLAENRSPAEFSALFTLEVSTRVKICATKDLISFCFMTLCVWCFGSTFWWSNCILRTECWIFCLKLCYKHHSVCAHCLPRSWQ